MSRFLRTPVTIAPCASSANLGPGFDALALGLSLRDRITASIRDSGLEIHVLGEEAESVSRDESHLVVRAMRTVFAALDVEPPGLALRCENAIPHARGLGSSAAAIVGGALVARGLVEGGEKRLPDEQLLQLAAELEGHPDNVAACLLGGVTLAWRSGAAGVRAVQLASPPALEVTLFVPSRPMATETARAALPPQVSHADAAANAARAALLVHALAAAPELLFDATEDRLHQPFRASVMPESFVLLESLRARGLPAVLSGAGPSVLVLGRVAPGERRGFRRLDLEAGETRA